MNNYIWIKKDAESLGWDVCHHVDITVSVHHELKEVILAKMPLYQKASQIARIFTSGRLEWPRFVHFFAAAISLPAQDMLFSFRFTNIFYLLIMIISVYLIGTLISGPQAGVLSAALVSFYPGLFQNSRKFGLDFPLAAVVCLSIYLLLASNQFRERRYSLLFGIVTGIGALIKGQILVYVSAPVLYSFFLIFKERRALPSGTLKNILMSAISFTAIALIWWHRVFSHEMVFALDKHMAWGSFPEPIPSPLLERFQGFITDTYLNISPALFWVFIAL
ncbi:MAG: glycosyltransferase family 39 protein [Candidatus Omnitrophica bacterium]|nr:glycosyltransferase family 39 protein [Candidatus Omnitrophota bacterium]